MIFISPTSWSFGPSPSLLLILYLALSASAPFGILWVPCLESYLSVHFCALQVYLQRTSSLSPRPRSLFVSPRSPSRPLSKNALSFFLRSVILLSFPSPSTTPSAASRAHSVRGMATSTAFSHNVPLSSILAAATWSSSTVFTAFYLRDVEFSSSSGFSLGPVVAVGAAV